MQYEYRVLKGDVTIQRQNTTMQEMNEHYNVNYQTIFHTLGTQNRIDHDPESRVLENISFFVLNISGDFT